MKKIILFTFIIAFISCDTSNNKCFVFPHGENICNKKIKDVEDIFNIEFKDYYGFYGYYDDSLLSKFILRFEDESNLAFGVLRESDIIEYKNQYIQSIRFDKIIDESITKDILLTYLLDLYEGASYIEESEKLLFIVKEESKLVMLEYDEIGIPGYFVTLLPQPLIR